MGERDTSEMATVAKRTVLLLLCAAVFASASPMVQYHQTRRSGGGSGSGSGSLAPTLAPSLAPTTMAPSATPTKDPTGAPANTQTIVQTIPGVDSAATFDAEPNVKSAYEKGYG